MSVCKFIYSGTCLQTPPLNQQKKGKEPFTTGDLSSEFNLDNYYRKVYLNIGLSLQVGISSDRSSKTGITVQAIVKSIYRK